MALVVAWCWPLVARNDPLPFPADVDPVYRTELLSSARVTRTWL
jgi:hypothetical protein